MADSNITVSGLALTPGVGHNLAKWSFVDPNAKGLDSLKLDAVELWAVEVNSAVDRTLATKVGEGRDGAAHMGVVEGQSYWYWIKARNRSGYYGDWYPTSASAGITGTVGFSSALSALTNGRPNLSVASNALTISIVTLVGSGSAPSSTNPVYCGFRSAAGDYVVRAITSGLSLVAPNGATLGAVSGKPLRFWIVLFDDGGTVRLGLINCADITNRKVFPLGDYGTASGTLMSASATAAGTFYASAAVTSKAFRVIGFLEYDNLVTAGTYNASPDRSRLYGAGIYLPGDIVQVRVDRGDSVPTGTASIPFDDTIPQIGEGDEYLSTTFTPTSRANFVENDFIIFGSNSNASSLQNTAALFRAGNDDALAVAWGKQAAVDEPLTLSVYDFRQIETSGDHTYSARAGGSSAGNTNFTLHGFNGSRKFGGAMRSQLCTREIMA